MMHSKLTLERELRELMGSGRNALIAARYYGLDGRGGESLQEVGNEIGVTRERIRQIVAAASKRVRTGRPVSPTLDQTIAFVIDRMPAAAAEIEAELRSERLTAGLFRLEGVIKAAELLRTVVPFSISEVKGERIVHARDIPSVGTIVRTARRLISRWGMTTLSNVVGEVRKVVSGICDRKLVVSALTCLEDFHWLEQSGDWFWLSTNHNNAVLNRIRKILSVANPIYISELRAAIGRDYLMNGFSPPKRIFLEFCRQAPGLLVNDNTIKAISAISPVEVLTQAESGVLRILSEHSGTMTALEAWSVCLRMGMNRNSFYACLEHSPIISRYAGGLYGLIGSGYRAGSRKNHSANSSLAIQRRREISVATSRPVPVPTDRSPMGVV